MSVITNPGDLVFEIRYQIDGQSAPYVVVGLSGEIDCSNVHVLRDVMDSACEQGIHVALDLARVPYLSSAAVSVLLLTAMRCRERGSLFSIHRTQPLAARVIEALGLERELRVDETAVPGDA